MCFIAAALIHIMYSYKAKRNVLRVLHWRAIFWYQEPPKKAVLEQIEIL